jgi:hypothetical protein
MKKGTSEIRGTGATAGSATITRPTSVAGIPELVERALEISANRRQTLERLRTALEQGNDAEALQIAKELCGLENDQKCYRADPRVN